MTAATEKLAKHYGALSAAQRFRLAMNAQLRGDDAEADRLIDSSPTVVRSMPDLAGRAAAFAETLSAQWVLRVDTAGTMYRCLMGRRISEDSDPLFRCARSLAATLLAHRDAWVIFCGAEGIDGAERQGASAGGDLVASAERLAEAIRFEPDELLAYVREKDPDREAVPTASERARELREYFAERLRYWRAG